MKSEILAKRTAKRISSLTEVELVSSINELENHPIYSRSLLGEIHSQKSFEDIGRALMLALYEINQKDLILHWEVDSE